MPLPTEQKPGDVNFSTDSHIVAQHDETGRVWHGLRSELPPRYTEVNFGRDTIERLRAQRDAMFTELLAIERERDRLRLKIASLRHHVRALQTMCKAQHTENDLFEFCVEFCAEVEAIDAVLNQ